MSAAKIGVITLFLLMAIGGVMLAGYTFILRAG
ncbi:protein YohO [Citrobacter portucalensis]|nr:protein YohO [Citrobacter portucalensis]MCX8985419.1 protein YohO [Citrobacter portucalensis]